ncbi:hypothetical protein LINPERPRIM_LOCUS27372 [Linum perenne]
MPILCCNLKSYGGTIGRLKSNIFTKKVTVLQIILQTSDISFTLVYILLIVVLLQWHTGLPMIV